jgi:5-methylcytosine-specific restriction endonuclease McrA
LVRLREKRRKAKGANKAARRALTAKQRDRVLKKTGGRCHICGGEVGRRWHADHVASHALGGEHAEDNFLPAHELCNSYRRHYLPDEFQIIMKLGIWARTQIERETPVGVEIAERFTAHERTREKRRVTR